MIKLGLLWTGYLILSFVIFLLASFTINGWIVYIFVLLPLYGLILLFGWLRLLKHRNERAQFSHGRWLTVIVLQIAVLLTSPGNCYMANQGARCYSNFQILFDNVPQSGMVLNAPHWIIVEDSFYGFVLAYCVALIIGVWSTKFKTDRENNLDLE
ncbi:hypothetical protein Lepto7376_1228 [[Leptolyngbya] sp. PCC 7376]|uniref:hypothetical protein n=1 Tax=[Leptolyngbya] sp. PCC 7376 TaxID=111781 RepID=UPI00029EF1BD|nr:hypothetical protein [[Leptolyngbya] sp. PCC 7376]AFY37584.1 hypothetical protein Lepto7376_1228 [[Leptolyngbya] sp. PCC 7376]